MQPLAPDDPSCIGPYRLLGRLGAGGMGRVFLARCDDGSPGTVAVKLVRPELAELAEFRRRFAREVRVARRVNERWTAPVLDADTDANVPWVATAYVPGPTLQAVVRGEFGPLPSASAHILAYRMALALRGIHAVELVHRDLKPSNVLLAVDGPRVIDFGIAHVLDAAADSLHTPAGALIGSPEFMSPEQVRGEPVSPASDVFSLGCVLGYAATGRSPFDAEERSVHSVLFHIAYEDPELGAIPEAFSDLVKDCLAKDPADRPGVDEILERTRRAPAGAWLPPELLARLDRAAARPLPHKPWRRADAESPAQNTGVQAEFPEPSRPVAPPDPLELPEAGIAPPRIRPRPRARWSTWRSAAATIAVTAALAGLGLGARAVERTVFDEPAPRTDLKPFTGTWVLRQEAGRPLFVIKLDIWVSQADGTTRVQFEAGRRGATCLGKAQATSPGRGQLLLSHFREQQKAPENGGPCAPGRMLLTADGASAVDPSISWQARKELSIGAESVNTGAQTVPPQFKGTWRRGNTTIRIRENPGDATVTTTVTSRGQQCTWDARVLYMDAGVESPTQYLHAMPGLPASEGCPPPNAAYSYMRDEHNLIRTALNTPSDLALSPAS
ncbi:serine/threonine-protein kinase [Streptomyces sp. NPDC055400]